MRPVQFVLNVVVPSLVAISSLPAGADRVPYSSGQLTPTEAVDILYLAWPQSYGAMRDRFGYPAYRGPEGDYYFKPDGSLLRINYSDDNRAIGYRWEAE
jgi:hypothetical protein